MKKCAQAGRTLQIADLNPGIRILVEPAHTDRPPERFRARL